jgi:hypothetical protein
MSVLLVLLFIIPLAITLAGIVLIGVVLIRAMLVILISLVPFPLNSGGFSASSSGFNIQVLG